MASFVITRKLLFISRVDKCLNILNVRYESKNKYFKRIEYSYYNVRDIKVEKTLFTNVSCLQLHFKLLKVISYSFRYSFLS